MYRNYEAGSKGWTKIGKLTRKEKVSLIKDIETDIKNGTTHPDEYFYWLSISFGEYKSDAETFREFSKNGYYLEKLEWLRIKNLKLEYKTRIATALEGLGDHSSNLVNELLDTCTELTALID